MTTKKMNILKIAVVASMFSTHAVMPNSVVAKKTINWSNAAKASFSTAACVAGVLFYYKSIIEPYVVILAKTKGLDYAIQFNKQFVQDNPMLALYFASPLIIAAGCAWIARDYVNKIWEDEEQENEQRLEEEQNV